MEYPVFKLNACKYEDLNKNTPVFNKNAFEYFLYVYIEPELARNFQLFQVDELGDTLVEVPLSFNIKKERNWVKILFSVLNQTPGQHIYKISMIGGCSNDVMSLYFSYIVQDDNPDKSYVYMKNR